MKVKSTAPSKRHNGTPLSLLRLALRSAATVIIEAFVLARRLDSEGIGSAVASSFVYRVRQTVAATEVLFDKRAAFLKKK